MNRFVSRTALALVLGSGLLGAAQAAEYTQVDAAASRIAFTYKQMQVGMNGSFAKFDTTLRFDPAHPEKAQATVKVTLASVDAGSKPATSSATTKEWLDVAGSPLAVFESTQVKSLGNQRFEATGTLTIKGKSQPASSTFTVKEQGKTAVLEGTLPLKRTAFGIGEGAWSDTSIVADEIQVSYRITAVAP